MRRLLLPGTDLTVSALCLGTASFGSRLSEAESRRMLDHFVDLGGNFIDTALNYADWHHPEPAISEKVIGRWLRSRPDADEIVVATKGACPRPDRFFRVTPECIRADVTASLAHLQVETIPLYWLHRDDPSMPVGPIIDVLNELVAVGHIRHFACSNWTADRIEQAQAHAETHGLQGFVADQLMWSLAEPGPLADKTIVVMDPALHALHTRTGLPAVAFSAQAKGLFSGRYDREHPPPQDSAVAPYWTEANRALLDRVLAAATRHDVAPAAVALAALSQQPFPTIPVIGASTLDQLTESCAGADLVLTDW
ncbi:MAG TPA: aldo/keto reductase [Candidatus Avipropionibacterium avicola]|uniref:Aldo/keto reductase n=1 Tax=Candidatus Avipropionibacterium avicola TaxID=2840701 RepID=A0A9D1GXT0_9ACTN|nr:aldo/keto reductase [Candidatus Avipropionibacterium avicola]